MIYLADQDVDEVLELYSVPIDGGIAIGLNDELVPGGITSTFKISSDDKWLLYRATPDTPGVVELYSRSLKHLDHGVEPPGCCPPTERGRPTSLPFTPPGLQAVDEDSRPGNGWGEDGLFGTQPITPLESL